MASDLFVCDGSFFSDPFSPFTDSLPIDILQPIVPDDHHHHHHQIDQIDPSSFLSYSPPNHQFQNLSISYPPTTQFPDLSALEVKTEEPQLGFSDLHSFRPHSYGGGTESAIKLMQKSYSSNSIEGNPGFLFHPRLDSLIMESPNFQFSTGQMRRVCSTGDLQMKTGQTSRNLSTSPLATERSLFMEEGNIKVGRYSAEERKERIHRYRAKRTQRNFNKTIKYACRKTLADNRPRVRGRFVRMDETGEIPKSSVFSRYEEDDDDLWIDGCNEEDYEGMVGRGAFFKSYCPNQIQYCGY